MIFASALELLIWVRVVRDHRRIRRRLTSTQGDPVQPRERIPGLQAAAGLVHVAVLTAALIALALSEIVFRLGTALT